MNSKDLFILRKIVSYCGQTRQARALFGDTREAFLSSSVYQNACCMCILQIGELAGKLSDEALGETPDIPWKQIRGMRNLCAHNYGEIDLVSAWATLQKDVPALEKRCAEMIDSSHTNTI